MPCRNIPVSISRARALDYADDLISIPRSSITVTLRQTKNSVTLLHGGHALTKCHINRSGMRTATWMADALGVQVPPLGQQVQAQVSTAVIWRAVAISCLNLRKKESFPILERLLNEAQMQRDGLSADV